jgi:hypothetical protein
MTRDGFTRLVMSFTGEKAGIWIEKYIAAFTEGLKADRVAPPAATFRETQALVEKDV